MNDRHEIDVQESIIKTNLRAAKWIAGYSKWYWLVIILSSLTNNLTPFINIFMSAQIINEIAGARNTAQLVNLVVITLSLNFAIGIASLILSRISKYTRQQQNFGEHRAFLNKVLDCDFRDLENGTISEQRWNVYQYSKVNNFGIGAMVDSSKRLMDNLVNIVLSLAGMGTLIFVLGNAEGLLFAAMIFILIAAFIAVSLRNSKKLAQLGEKISADRKIYNEVSEVFGEPGKDCRIYNMREIIEGFWEKKLEILNKNNRIYYTGHRNTQIPEVLLSHGLNFTIYAFVGINALAGLFGIGSVVLYVGYIQRFVTAVKEMAANLSMFRMNHYFLYYYLEYVQVVKTAHTGKLTPGKRQNEIEFRNVSFKYDGQENYALKNLNFKLTIGNRMAVAGMNGSGKTTMIKLLCRLYDPTEGAILLNGTDIREYDYDAYVTLFSVVFQDFTLFSFTLGQNISASMDINEAKAEKCLADVGFGERLAALPKGLQTPINKDFEDDGVELSGGEAQKIAMARALYKNAPFIILDEPTAALDPIAEHEVYSRFDQNIGGKTAIYISHRLSSCRFCDDIAVFHEGELIQRGNHDALVKDTGGKYFELWNSQAQYYV